MESLRGTGRNGKAGLKEDCLSRHSSKPCSFQPPAVSLEAVEEASCALGRVSVGHLCGTDSEAQTPRVLQEHRADVLKSPVHFWKHVCQFGILLRGHNIKRQEPEFPNGSYFLSCVPSPPPNRPSLQYHQHDGLLTFSPLHPLDTLLRSKVSLKPILDFCLYGLGVVGLAETTWLCPGL